MEITPEQTEALKIAREMAEAGIPIFVCPPNRFKPGKYYYRHDWQNTVADPSIIDQWQPGWGIAAVGGGAADFLDMDPRSGGLESQIELKNAGQWPLSFGQQGTPSGGTHDVISRTGERKETAVLPGIDFQAGGDEPDEKGSYGRAFVWIAPTVGVSKETGELVPYRWVQPPDLAALDEWRRPDGTSSDTSTEGIVARVHAKRAAKPVASTAPRSAFEEISQLFTNGGGHEPFTKAEAEHFLEGPYQRLLTAPIGEIEERAMGFTLAIERFVPAFWSVEEAFGFVCQGLEATAYDPHGPSDWTADKFLARLDGRRPVLDSWKAVRRVSPEEAAAAFGHAETVAPPPSNEQEAQDLVQALIGKMLSPQQMTELPPPQPLIKGLLDLDSLAWMIGQPGSFKSFVSLHMAACVGTGLPCFGMEVTQGPVVYIAAEGTRGMGKRIRAWERKYGHMGDVRFLPLPIKINDTVAWQTLIEACRVLQPVMIVIDTQARVAAGIEENSNTEMSRVIEAFDAIKTVTGGCVLVVHHTTKSGETTRGAGAQDGAQDTRIRLERVSPRSSMIVKFSEDKQKDMAEGAEGIKLRLVEEVLSEHGQELLTSLRIGDAFEMIAGTGEAEGPKVYVPTFDQKDVWRQRVLDALFLYAPPGGWLLGDLCARLEQDFGAERLKRNGAFTKAWAELLKLTDADGDLLITQNGQRFEVGSLSLREGLKIKYPEEMS